MRKILIIIIIMSATSSHAQVKWDADTYFENGYWVEAISEYEEVLDNSSEEQRVEVWKRIAVANYQLKNYSAANDLFLKPGVSNSLNSDDLAIYFDVLRVMEEYEKVQELLSMHETIRNSDNYEHNFISYPLQNIDKSDAYFSLKKIEADFGRAFFGMHLIDKGGVLSLPVKNKDNKTMFYDLFQVPFKNDTTFDIQSAKALLDDKRKVFYRGAPTLANYGSGLSSQYVYSGSQSEYDWYKDKKIEKFEVSKSGANVLALYSVSIDSLSSESRKIAELNTTNSNTVTPYYWAEQKVLFFSSDKPGGKGGLDIYYSRLIVEKSGTNHWSTPVNASFANSEYDDVFPFVFDGKLFFSSRGHENFGGLDVFSVEIEADTEAINPINKDGKPENMGKPINSSFDDFSLVWKSETKGYLSSNRNTTNGADEVFFFNYNVLDTINSLVVDDLNNPLSAIVNVYIRNEDNEWEKVETVQLDDDGKLSYPVSLKERYKFEFENEGQASKTLFFPDETVEERRDYSKKHFEIVQLNDLPTSGIISDEITEQLIVPVGVKIYTYENGERILVKELVTGEDGTWEHLFDRSRDYEVEMDAKGYDKKVFEVPGSGGERKRKIFINELTKTTLAQESKEGDIIKINNIYFEFNSAKITDESLSVLDNVIVFLNAKPTIRIELGAHTDCVGSNSYNLKLSQKRAKSCFEYLVNNGISPSRLKSKGYGETKILNSCTKPNQCSEEENEINRRIEIKIL